MSRCARLPEQDEKLLKAHSDLCGVFGWDAATWGGRWRALGGGGGVGGGGRGEGGGGGGGGGGGVFIVVGVEEPIRKVGHAARRLRARARRAPTAQESTWSWWGVRASASCPIPGRGAAPRNR